MSSRSLNPGFLINKKLRKWGRPQISYHAGGFVGSAIYLHLL